MRCTRNKVLRRQDSNCFCFVYFLSSKTFYSFFFLFFFFSSFFVFYLFVLIFIVFFSIVFFFSFFVFFFFHFSFSFSFWWGCLPSPPFGVAAFSISSVGWCCLVSFVPSLALFSSAWCCLVSSLFGWSLLFGGAAFHYLHWEVVLVSPVFCWVVLLGLLLLSGGVDVFHSPFWWGCLPSPPSSVAAFSISSVGWCCLVSSFFGWCCVSPLLPFVLWVGTRQSSTTQQKTWGKAASPKG